MAMGLGLSKVHHGIIKAACHSVMVRDKAVNTSVCLQLRTSPRRLQHCRANSRAAFSHCTGAMSSMYVAGKGRLM